MVDVIPAVPVLPATGTLRDLHGAPSRSFPGLGLEPPLTSTRKRIREPPLETEVANVDGSRITQIPQAAGVLGRAWIANHELDHHQA